MIVLGGVAFLIFCGVIYWQQYKTTSVLSSRGIVIDGVLDDSYTENLRNRIPESYTVTYKFVLGGQTYNGTSKLKTRPTTRTVKVAYDPQNPETNQAVGSENFYDGMEILFAALVIGLGLAAVRFVVLRFTRLT